MSSSPRCFIPAGSGQFTSKCISESTKSWCALMRQRQWLQNWHSSAHGRVAVEWPVLEAGMQVRRALCSVYGSLRNFSWSSFRICTSIIYIYIICFFCCLLFWTCLYIYIHNIYIYIYSWAGSPVPGLVFGSQGPSVLEQSLQHLNVWSPMGPMLALLVGPKWHLRWFVWDWCQTCHMFESKCSEDIYVHGHWCQCLRTDWDARFLGRA